MKRGSGYKEDSPAMSRSDNPQKGGSHIGDPHVLCDCQNVTLLSWMNEEAAELLPWRPLAAEAVVLDAVVLHLHHRWSKACLSSAIGITLEAAGSSKLATAGQYPRVSPSPQCGAFPGQTID